MIDDEIEIANLFDEYFINIIKKLGIFAKEKKCSFHRNSLSEAEIAIAKYRNHPSINVITEKMGKFRNLIFGFDFTLYEETLKEVSNSKIRKVSQKTGIPVKNVKENIDIATYFLYHDVSNSLPCSTFFIGIRYETDIENYCPISILSNLCKVYERLMYNQMYPYFHTIFSNI